MESETNPDQYRRYFELRPSSSMNESVRPSVWLSVRPSHLFHHVPIIVSSWNFQELSLMTKVMSMRKVKVGGQGHRGHNSTVTPVRINIWWSNDAYSLMLLRRGAPLFFKVICQISRSPGSKNRRIWPRSGVSGCNSSLNPPMATKWCTKLEVA